MAEPIRPVRDPAQFDVRAREERELREMRRALGGWARAARTRIAGPARLLPGLAAAGCAVAGAWLLWSLGVALLVAAGLLLLVDARTPRA